MDAIVYTTHINNDINKINSFLGIIQNVIKSPVQCCEAALFHIDIVKDYKEEMIIIYGLSMIITYGLSTTPHSAFGV